MDENPKTEHSAIQVCADIMRLCLAQPAILIYFDACLALLQAAIVTGKLNELGDGLSATACSVLPQGGTETIQ